MQRTAAINSEGLGLGLTMVKQIVESADGAVGVQSDGINKGSLFSFSMQMEKGQQNKTEQEDQQCPQKDEYESPHQSSMEQIDDLSYRSFSGLMNFRSDKEIINQNSKVQFDQSQTYANPVPKNVVHMCDQKDPVVAAPSVLIVDDDSLAVEYQQQLMTREGLSYDSCHDGERAISIIHDRIR